MTVSRVFGLLFGNILRFFQNLVFPRAERGPISWKFVGTLAVVLVYGLVMLFSASYSTGYYRFKGDIYHFIAPQTVFAVLGFVVMLVISRFNYRALRHVTWYLYALTLILLVVALFSEEQNGCHRWVYIFGSSFQPSELAKFAVILGLAGHGDQYYQQRKTLLHGIVLPLAPLVPIVVLLRLEPHNSAILLLGFITLTMMICGGIGRRWLPVVVPLLGAAAWYMLTSQDNYVDQRLGAWGLTSGASDTETLYQTRQSLYSIASGGLMGLGIGNSRQKHLWLPEATNDFIFSVLCEELGFIGALVCIALFAALIVQGILIAMRAPDYYGSMLGIGIVAQVAWQVFCHIGVVTATLPNTGISLPFFSSGGSSLMLLLGEMGVLLSISRAGNARMLAQQRQQQEVLARRMNTDGRRVYRRHQTTL